VWRIDGNSIGKHYGLGFKILEVTIWSVKEVFRKKNYNFSGSVNGTGTIAPTEEEPEFGGKGVGKPQPRQLVRGWPLGGGRFKLTVFGSR